MFLTDVTHCVASLKKMLQDLHNNPGALDTQLQMAHPVLRFVHDVQIPARLIILQNFCFESRQRPE